MTNLKKETSVSKNNSLSLADFNQSVAETNIENNEQIAVLLQRAKFVPTEELTLATTSYQKLENEETYIFFVKGIAEKCIKSMSANPTPGEEYTDAVELINEKGEDVINADVVMLSTVRKFKAAGKLPCMVQVYVDGEKGVKGATYKNLVIYRY